MNEEQQNQRTEEIKKQQEAFLQNRLARGYAFEHLINTDGWKYVQAYIENSLRAFTNTTVIKGFSSIEEFNIERGKILGMHQILNDIEGDLQAVKDERAKQQSAQPVTTE